MKVAASARRPGFLGSQKANRAGSVNPRNRRGTVPPTALNRPAADFCSATRPGTTRTQSGSPHRERCFSSSRPPRGSRCSRSRTRASSTMPRCVALLFLRRILPATAGACVTFLTSTVGVACAAPRGARARRVAAARDHRDRRRADVRDRRAIARAQPPPENPREPPRQLGISALRPGGGGSRVAFFFSPTSGPSRSR